MSDVIVRHISFYSGPILHHTVGKCWSSYNHTVGQERVKISIWIFPPSQIYKALVLIVARKNQEFRFLFLPLSNGGYDSYMTVFSKGWAAAKPRTGSSYIALGWNTRKTLYPAVTLQLGEMTVGDTRMESTEHSFPSVIFIATRITLCTLMWCLLCRNTVTAISMAPLFRLSGVISKYCDI
jgi:hypothetical protein